MDVGHSKKLWSSSEWLKSALSKNILGLNIKIIFRQRMYNIGKITNCPDHIMNEEWRDLCSYHISYTNKTKLIIRMTHKNHMMYIDYYLKIAHNSSFNFILRVFKGKEFQSENLKIY